MDLKKPTSMSIVNVILRSKGALALVFVCGILLYGVKTNSKQNVSEVVNDVRDYDHDVVTRKITELDTTTRKPVRDSKPDDVIKKTPEDKNQNDDGDQLPEAEVDKIVEQMKPPEDNGPIPVVLLTYMRSGSSFLGKVLQLNSDVFYLFEPVHKIQFAVRDNLEFHYLNKPTRKVDNFLDIASESVAGFSTCNFEDVTLMAWEENFISESKKGRQYRECMKESSSQAKTCLDRIIRLCKESKHIVMKIIRIPMSLLEPLLEKIPKMKIIYLLRDPRATVKSQNKFGVVRSNFLRADVLRYCNRVYNDYTKMEDLKQKFPNSIKTVFYEDISKNPMTITKDIYDFIDMKFTDAVESQIKQMTHSSKECGAMCTYRSNSSAQAEAWRKDIRYDFVKTVDSLCQPLYSKVGYLNVQDEMHLRNTNAKLRRESPVFDDYRYA